MRTKYIYIKDVIGEVVAKTNAALKADPLSWLSLNNKDINYVYGGKSHIIQQLTSIKDGTKYPMVALMLGTGVKKGTSGGYFGQTIIKAIYIAAFSDNKSLPAAKYQKNFQPILEPIYTELMEQLAMHRSIVESDQDDMPHEVWEHPADNTIETNTVFTDFLDIMAIYNLTFTLHSQPFNGYVAGI